MFKACKMYFDEYEGELIGFIKIDSQNAGVYALSYETFETGKEAFDYAFDNEYNPDAWYDIN